MFHKQKSLHQNVANLETSVTKRFSSTTIPRKKNCHEDLVLLLLERMREERKGKVTEQQEIIQAAEPSSPSTGLSPLQRSGKRSSKDAPSCQRSPCPSAVPELSCPSPNKISLSSRAGSARNEEKPFHHRVQVTLGQRPRRAPAPGSTSPV